MKAIIFFLVNVDGLMLIPIDRCYIKKKSNVLMILRGNVLKFKNQVKRSAGSWKKLKEKFNNFRIQLTGTFTRIIGTRFSPFIL